MKSWALTTWVERVNCTLDPTTLYK